MKISFICPSRNNLKYLKWSLGSILQNKGEHDVEFCIWDDFSDDGTEEWLLSENWDEYLMLYGIHVKWNRNDGPSRLGHTILYDKIVSELATNNLCMIWHADMYLCPGALNAIEKLMFMQIDRPSINERYERTDTTMVNYKKRITSLTRIEPPLHPGGVEKIVANFGTEPETFNFMGLSAQLGIFEKVDSWKYTCNFFPSQPREITVPLKGTTNGVFAPWAFWKDEFLEIGGHDPLFAPQSKEDSDIWNRLLLNGTKFIQTWTGFVYHMTCRGSRFNPTLTTPGKNSSEWENQNIRSTRNFIRKWGSMVQHDEYLHPIVPHKYSIGFVTGNISYNLLYNLEPWCDELVIEVEPEIIDRYIEFEQPNTKFNLRDKINPKKRKRIPDVIVRFNSNNLTQEDFVVLQHLSEILTDSGEENSEMEIGNLKLNIGKLNHYENELIVCQK